MSVSRILKISIKSGTSKTYHSVSEMMTFQDAGTNLFKYSSSSSRAQMSQIYPRQTTAYTKEQLCKVKTLNCPVCDMSIAGGKNFNLKRHLKKIHGATCCLSCMKVLHFDAVKTHVC